MKEKNRQRSFYKKNLNKIRFGLRLIGFDFLRPVWYGIPLQGVTERPVIACRVDPLKFQC